MNDTEPDLVAAAQRLADALKNSRLYQEYRRSRLRVEEQPELAYRLRMYKKTQTAYEYKRLRDGGDPDFNEEKHISHIHGELMLNPDTRAFLEREDAFLTVYRQVMEVLEIACDIELFNT